jgi:hypothetical protein
VLRQHQVGEIQFLDFRLHIKRVHHSFPIDFASHILFLNAQLHSGCVKPFHELEFVRIYAVTNRNLL